MPLSARDVQDFLEQEFPQSSVTVEAIGPMSARVRQTIDEGHLRPGGTVSGPVMMSVADVATYAAVLAEIGLVPLVVTTSLNINFLRKPAAGRNIVGEATLIKLGKRLAVADVRITSEGEQELVAHATVTYSVPPR